MLPPRLGRIGLQALASTILAHHRGEGLATPPDRYPHHLQCACGFDRWDGASEHPWSGKRFALRRCRGGVPCPRCQAYLPAQVGRYACTCGAAVEVGPALQTRLVHVAQQVRAQPRPAPERDPHRDSLVVSGVPDGIHGGAPGPRVLAPPR